MLRGALELGEGGQGGAGGIGKLVVDLKEDGLIRLDDKRAIHSAQFSP